MTRSEEDLLIRLGSAEGVFAGLNGLVLGELDDDEWEMMMLLVDNERWKLVQHDDERALRAYRAT
jgi:hypothetical protein